MKYKVIHPHTDKILGDVRHPVEALKIFADNDLYGIVVLEPFKDFGMCFLLDENSEEVYL